MSFSLGLVMHLYQKVDSFWRKVKRTERTMSARIEWNILSVGLL
jgi:hypothetical protein